MNDLKIRGFIREVGENAEKHGFHDVTGSPLEYLAMIHSEVSEIVGELRKGWSPDETYYGPDRKPEGVPTELADVVLRCFDFAYVFGIDLEGAILEKHSYNADRPYLHGRKF